MHKLSTAGVCQRCGEFRAEQLKQDCAPRVVYSAARNSVIDYITPGGVTFYGGKTLAQCQQEDPDAEVMDAETAFTRYQSGFIKAPVEVTEERFHDALNVLPPCKWTGPGTSESFYVSERIAGNVVSWFVRNGEKFYRVDNLATLTHGEVLRLVIQHTTH